MVRTAQQAGAARIVLAQGMVPVPQRYYHQCPFTIARRLVPIFPFECMSVRNVAIWQLCGLPLRVGMFPFFPFSVRNVATWHRRLPCPRKGAQTLAPSPSTQWRSVGLRCLLAAMHGQGGYQEGAELVRRQRRAQWLSSKRLGFTFQG